MPPDFLHGSCDPHPANDEKRHRLYRLFWSLMSDIGYFRDPEYVSMKETRTVSDDTREILPRCVLEVILVLTSVCSSNEFMYKLRRFVDDTQVRMAPTGVICQHLRVKVSNNCTIVSLIYYIYMSATSLTHCSPYIAINYMFLTIFTPAPRIISSVILINSNQ